jgi:hypothetical protein
MLLIQLQLLQHIRHALPQRSLCWPLEASEIVFWQQVQQLGADVVLPDVCTEGFYVKQLLPVKSPHFPGSLVGKAPQALCKQLIKGHLQRTVFCQVPTFRSCRQQQGK